MALKTTYEEVKEVLVKPNLGHPSRSTENKISNIKETLLILANEASKFRY